MFNRKNVYTYSRVVIVLVAILLVASFTLYKWTTLLHRYGNYGSYVRQADSSKFDTEDTIYLLGGKFLFPFINRTASSSFEKETIYREAIKYQYDVAFRKIWTFGAFVFVSAFLLLLVIPNKKEE